MKLQNSARCQNQKSQEIVKASTRNNFFLPDTNVKNTPENGIENWTAKKVESLKKKSEYENFPRSEQIWKELD